MYKQIAARALWPQATIIPLKRKSYSIVAAAAVLVTLIGAGSYFWLLKKPAPVLPQAEVIKVKP
jgi:transmembrane sensor